MLMHIMINVILTFFIATYCIGEDTYLSIAWYASRGLSICDTSPYLLPGYSETGASIVVSRALPIGYFLSFIPA